MIGRTNGGAKGGGGELHGASIQVSTSEASLIGTVCQLKQNNTVIKTKVFNSGGVALFTDIQEVDTYTVVATDGVDTATESVSVTATDIVNKTVLTSTVAFGTTITFDVYSAAQDTVYYYENGSPITLCVTDSTGKATGVSLTIPSGGKTLTLYSTVADNPNNLSEKYSQSVTFTNNFSGEIDLFPTAKTNILYWYGATPNNYAFHSPNGGTNASWPSNVQKTVVEKANTNYIDCSENSKVMASFYYEADTSNATLLKSIQHIVTSIDAALALGDGDASTINNIGLSQYCTVWTVSNYNTTNVESHTLRNNANEYLHYNIHDLNGETCYVYALWLE